MLEDVATKLSTLIGREIAPTALAPIAHALARSFLLLWRQGLKALARCLPLVRAVGLRLRPGRAARERRHDEGEA